MNDQFAWLPSAIDDSRRRQESEAPSNDPPYHHPNHGFSAFGGMGAPPAAPMGPPVSSMHSFGDMNPMMPMMGRPLHQEHQDPFAVFPAYGHAPPSLPNPNPFMSENASFLSELQRSFPDANISMMMPPMEQPHPTSTPPSSRFRAMFTDDANDTLATEEFDLSRAFGGLMRLDEPQNQAPRDFGHHAAPPSRKSQAKPIDPHHRPPTRQHRPPEHQHASDGASTVHVTPEAVKPNDQIKVQVSLLSDECIPGRILVVGLFRVGQPVNEKPIFIKQVLFENKLNRNYRFVNTRITFRAPRSPGEFEFRIFEQVGDKNNEENGDASSNGRLYSNATIARSNVLKVNMDYSYFMDAVRSVKDKLDHGRDHGDAGGVLSAMLSLLRLIDQVDTVFLHGNALLEDVLDQLLELLEIDPDSIAATYAVTESIPSPIETFHGTMRNVLNAIQLNRSLNEFLAPDMLQKIEWYQSKLYCAVTGLYFPSEALRAAYWKEQLGFAPLGRDPEIEKTIYQSTFVQVALSKWLWKQAAQLIPDPDAFRRTRQAIYETIHREIISKLSIQADLDVFGSSANDFGQLSSDMDMCLVLPKQAQPVTSEAKQAILTEVVALLERHPDVFTAIDTCRLTARIPIIMFTMVESGIECDLCVENALAQRNTSFLRAYAHADARVRPLAYVLKQLVKRRRMNCAAEGTLSSYGYLLMLIHFLQQQTPPIVPVLQVLSPQWHGKRKCDCTTTARWCARDSAQCDLNERMDNMALPIVLTHGPDGENNNTASGHEAGKANVYETYFYDPFAYSDSAHRLQLLQSFGQQNDTSLGELFVHFLAYFGLQFDASRQVVSVRMRRILSKEEKKHECHWRMHTRLSVEDPFEVSYDVAHVLKGSRDKYIRQQLVRAYSLLATAALKDQEDVDQIMEQVWASVTDVPFATRSEQLQA